MMPRFVCTAAAVIAAAGCHEPTAARVGAAAVSWIEWPTAVTTSEPGAVRVSGSAQCPYRPVFGVSVDGLVIRVTATGHYRGDIACLDAGGSGAGYDTLLPLPELRAPERSLPATFYFRAPMGDPGYHGDGSVSERLIGYIDLRAARDTTTRLAGQVLLRADSTGCWLAMPFSAWPRPLFAFAKPVPLTPVPNWRFGYVSGRLVTANPPICGQALAIDAVELTVDATPF